MLRKIVSVRPAAWILLLCVAAFSAATLYATLTHTDMRGAVMYGIQPTVAMGLAIAAHYLARGKAPHIRHSRDKAITIASVLAIWFVLYFASGIFLTYIHNALVSSPISIALNILGFGVTAASIEYARYRLMLMVGRRNIIWFGVLVTLVFAAQQMNLVQAATLATAEDIIKLGISDIVPAIVTSALLTYLCSTAGLPSVLTFRLGLVAIAILPPLIPKFDWYLTGISTVLVAVAVYLIIDHSQQEGHQPRTRRHLNFAVEATWACALVALTLFMSGVFAYKPHAIMSDSMKPLYARGSMVIIQKLTDTMDINIGDIIQYERQGLLITHRVIDIRHTADNSGERIFITQGDNSPSRDEPVPLKNVKGIVRTYVPYIGYPTVWLREFTVGNRSNEVNR